MKTHCISFTRFRRDYNAGQESGARHWTLSEYFQKQNARKCGEGTTEATAKWEPRIYAYWVGYRDGMELASPTKETE
jgi:hypothetical protein